MSLSVVFCHFESTCPFNAKAHYRSRNFELSVLDFSVRGTLILSIIVEKRQTSGTCDLDNLNLRRQSSNPKETWFEAEIVVEGKSVAVNCSILSERSQFFRRLFNLRNDGKPKYLMTDLVPHGKVGYEAFNDILNRLYTGKLKAPPPEVSACVDDACAHDACRPAINYAIELMYASAAFQMKEFVSFYQSRLLYMVWKAPVEDVIPILVAALHWQLNKLRSDCIERIAGSNLDNVCLEKELPDGVSREIKSLRVKSNQESEANIAEMDPMHAKVVRRIHKALDSDDVELLKLLLDVSNVTLDDAYALHYAAAYCNPKVFKEVLNMDLAGLNLKDARGRTVLHVAARRNEPEVMVSLLSKGACASETTSDWQTAVAICRRMTRRKDYIEASKQGQETNKDWFCIDVLEREMRRNSMSRFPPKKFLDCDWSDASLLENGTPEEQNRKRARFMELKEDVQKAFYKDMAEKNRSGLLSSSSLTSSPKEGVKCEGRKR